MVDKSFPGELASSLFDLVQCISAANASFCELAFFASAKVYKEYRRHALRRREEPLGTLGLDAQVKRDLASLHSMRRVGHTRRV